METHFPKTSTECLSLTVPRINTALGGKAVDGKAFPLARPKLWNTLPHSLFLLLSAFPLRHETLQHASLRHAIPPFCLIGPTLQTDPIVNLFRKCHQ